MFSVCCLFSHFFDFPSLFKIIICSGLGVCFVESSRKVYRCEQMTRKVYRFTLLPLLQLDFLSYLLLLLLLLVPAWIIPARHLRIAYLLLRTAAADNNILAELVPSAPIIKPGNLLDFSLLLLLPLLLHLGALQCM